MARSGANVTIQISGAAMAFANEATTGDGGRKVYQITDAAKQVWDPKAPITVQTSTDGGETWTAADPTTYALDRLLGRVAFATQQAAGTTVQLSGTYLPMTVSADAHGWTDTGTLNTADVTTFGSHWKKYMPTSLEVAGELDDFSVVDPFFRAALAAGDPVVLQFNDGVELSRYWALLNKDEVKGAADNPLDGTVSWQGVKDADGRVMSVE